MASHIMSLRISDEIKAQLDKLSSETRRPASTIAAEALTIYLAQQDDERKSLDTAVDRADNGNFVSDDAVREWLTSWGTPEEKPAPRANIVKTRR